MKPNAVVPDTAPVAPTKAVVPTAPEVPNAAPPIAPVAQPANLPTAIPDVVVPDKAFAELATNPVTCAAVDAVLVA